MKRILLAFLIGAAVGFAVGLFRPPRQRRGEATWSVETEVVEPRAQVSVK
jgi:gas vesicle protein